MILVHHVLVCAIHHVEKDVQDVQVRVPDVPVDVITLVQEHVIHNVLVVEHLAQHVLDVLVHVSLDVPHRAKHLAQQTVTQVVLEQHLEPL